MGVCFLDARAMTVDSSVLLVATGRGVCFLGGEITEYGFFYCPSFRRGGQNNGCLFSLRPPSSTLCARARTADGREERVDLHFACVE